MRNEKIVFAPHKVQILMGDRCMGVNELADISGVSRISIGKYLSGKSNPLPKTIGKIARALNVGVADIIADTAATVDNASK